MLSKEQEDRLERFSLEHDGRRVIVKELSNGCAVMKCGKTAIVVDENGETAAAS